MEGEFVEMGKLIGAALPVLVWAVQQLVLVT